MSQLIQQMESRVLMSATAVTLTAQADTVVSDATSTRLAFASLRTAEIALKSQVVRDVHALGGTRSQKLINRTLVNALQRAVNVNFSRVQADDNVFLANARARARSGEAHGKALLLHPSRTGTQLAVSRDVTALTDTLSLRYNNMLTALQSANIAVNDAYANISAFNASLTSEISAGQTSLTTSSAVFGTAATRVQTDAAALASSLSNPFTAAVSLTGATLFRGDSTGNNIDSNPNVITHGAWTTGLDVQNVPGNYAAELFISKVPNPTAADFLTPGTFAASLASGLNTFYFFANGDDTLGGTATFGLNLFLNNTGPVSPNLSGYTVPGSSTVLPDSASTTSGTNLVITPGAGTLSTAVGTSTFVTLSDFQVLGVSGQNSTVDLINSTNTQAFVAPPHADGVADTYGKFTITVS